MLGGPHSLSLGGYAGTPIDRLLPVHSLYPGRSQRRTLALELVLDRSGSMGDLAGGVAKIEMAKSAAAVAASFARRHADELGLVSFDAVPHVPVPLQRLDSDAVQRAVQAQIDTLTPSGGTDIYRGLDAALGEVLRSRAASRHIVLLQRRGQRAA